MRLELSDTIGILLLLWKGRDNTKLPRVLSDLLAFYVPDKETFKGIEFYLPQFVHLMLHVHTYPMDLILEELILLVSQQVCFQCSLMIQRLSEERFLCETNIFV